MSVRRYILGWVGITVAWLLAVPTYPYFSVFLSYSLVVLVVFSLMGAFGVLYRGRVEQGGNGFAGFVREFFISASERFSGARVGVAFLVAVNIHRMHALDRIDGSYVFALIFASFLLLAGPYTSSLKRVE